MKYKLDMFVYVILPLFILFFLGFVCGKLLFIPSTPSYEEQKRVCEYFDGQWMVGGIANSKHEMPQIEYCRKVIMVPSKETLSLLKEAEECKAMGGEFGIEYKTEDLHNPVLGFYGTHYVKSLSCKSVQKELFNSGKGYEIK